MELESDAALGRLQQQGTDTGAVEDLVQRGKQAMQASDWDHAQLLFCGVLEKCAIVRSQEQELNLELDLENASNPLFGDEDAHSIVDRIAATPRPADFVHHDPEQEHADLKEWAELKYKGWGRQLAALKPRGWVEPDPDYDEMDTQLGRRLFVLEHGFGTLVKVQKKKRGWAPCSVEFVDGGKKTIMMRLKGKEMGTPFLISPEHDEGPQIEAAAARSARSAGSEILSIVHEADIAADSELLREWTERVY
eukprot:SAG11_NODE_4008_length_2109_cov_1.548756_1_plen_250_part_00